MFLYYALRASIALNEQHYSEKLEEEKKEAKKEKKDNDIFELEELKDIKARRMVKQKKEKCLTHVNEIPDNSELFKAFIKE